MSELEKLLNELKTMKDDKSRSRFIANNKATWSAIGSRDLKAAGFESQEELNEWLESNPYANIY